MKQTKLPFAMTSTRPHRKPPPPPPPPPSREGVPRSRRVTGSLESAPGRVMEVEPVRTTVEHDDEDSNMNALGHHNIICIERKHPLIRRKGLRSSPFSNDDDDDGGHIPAENGENGLPPPLLNDEDGKIPALEGDNDLPPEPFKVYTSDTPPAFVPTLLPLNDAMENARQVMRVRYAMDDPAATDQERQKLEALPDIINEMLRLMYEEGIDVTHFWKLMKVTSNKGLYVMYKTLLDYINNRWKGGSSESDRFDRIARQDHYLSFRSLDVEEIKKLIPPDTINKLVALNLPRYGHHPCRREKVADSIATQLGELFMVSALEGCTESTAAEKLVKLPGPWARKLRQVAEREVPDKVVQFLLKSDGTPKRGKALTTWITPTTHLHQLETENPEDPFLPHVNCPIPEGEFATNFLFQLVLGQSFAGYQDAIKVPPVVTKHLEPFVARVILLLSNPVANAAAIQKEFKALRQLDPMLAPTPEELAVGAMQELHSMIQEIDPDQEMIYTEHVTIQALQRNEGAYFEATWRRRRDLDYDKMEFYESKSDPMIHLASTPSLYNALADNRTNKIRAGASFSIAAMGKLTMAAGILPNGSKERQKFLDCMDLLETYLMGLEGPGNKMDGDYRSVRKQISGPHWFDTTHPNMVSTSRLLGWPAPNLKYVGFKIGEEGRQAVATAYNVQGMMPWDPRYRCPGLFAVGNFAKEDCSRPPGTPLKVSLVGARSNHTFGGMQLFVCDCCHGKLRARENAYHKSIPDDAPEAIEHAARREELKRRRENHAGNESVKRQKRVQEDGIEKVQEYEREKNRRNQEKQALQRIAAAEEGRPNPARKKKAQPVRKGSNKFFSERKNGPAYPSALRAIMKMGCALLVKVKGQASITTTELHSVLHAVVGPRLHLLKAMNINVYLRDDNFTVQGVSRVEYQQIAMASVATRVGETRTWKVRDDFEQKFSSTPAIERMKGKTLEEQLRRVVQVINEYETRRATSGQS